MTGPLPESIQTMLNNADCTIQNAHSQLCSLKVTAVIYLTNYRKNSLKNKYKAHLSCALNFNILLNLNTKMQINSSHLSCLRSMHALKRYLPHTQLTDCLWSEKMLSAAAAAVSRKHRPVNHSLLQTNGCNELDSSPVWVNVCTQTYIKKSVPQLAWWNCSKFGLQKLDG